MHLAQNWRLKGARYALQTKHCIHCGAIVSLSRQSCPDCQAEPVEHYAFQGKNVRLSGFSVVEPAYDEIRQAAR